jgi:formate hydrogenlyase subunit 3/multisubunit Na+/H+ antiporter MnhD subunit
MSQQLALIGLILLTLWPMLVVLALAFRATRAMAMQLAPWAALPIFILVWFVPVTATLELPWLLLGSRLGIGGDTGHLFLLFTALLWWIAGLFARGYLTDQSRQTSFYIYFLLAMTGNLGLILAQDLGSFYMFFALMSFASYGLVVHEGSSAALRAGRIYLILVVIGELALFAAMTMAMAATDAIDFATVRAGLAQAPSRDLIILLALIGFGIKAGVIGLHVWLPLAHPVAPTPASAVLSGAMIKAGLLGWLRLLPLGETTMLGWAEVFILLGLTAAFFGVVVGLTQRDPKTLLAYSSISQMGIMTVGVGLALAAPNATPLILITITLYALHHGLNKGALFLGVGVITACHANQQRWVWWGLWLPALALAGVPLSSGMLVKGLLKAQVIHAPAHWVTLLPILLSASAVATTLLVGRFMVILANPKTATSAHGSAARLIWPWAMLLISTVVLPWWFAPAIPKLWSAVSIVTSTWPVLLGSLLLVTALLLTAYRRRQRGQEPIIESFVPQIPPGDLLVPVSYMLRNLVNTVWSCFDTQLPHWRDRLLSTIKKPWSHFDGTKILARIEAALMHWRSGLLLLLLIGLVMATMD